MPAINTEPLGKPLVSKPVNPLRVIVGVILYIFIFVGGALFSSRFNLHMAWIIACVVLSGFLTLYSLSNMGRSQRKNIDEFAKINSLKPLSKELMSNILPVSLKNIGWWRRFKNGYQITINEQPVYIFDYHFLSLDKTRSQISHDIAVIRTQKSHPHMYLDNRRNLTSVKYKAHHKMKLEGHFNDYFNLYADRKTNIETLSFLTPDVMELFMNSARVYDIEIYGQYIAIISTSDMGLYKKYNMDPLLEFLETILTKIPAQPITTELQTVNIPTLKKQSIATGRLITVLITMIIVVALVVMSS